MSEFRVIEGDCIEAMAAMPEASIDAIVCDPPYGLEFMGKEWDRLGAVTEQVTDTGNRDGNWTTKPFGGGGSRVRYGASAKSMQAWHEAWAHEALRVLRPGGYILAFGGTRTYHRLASGLEDAGFEVRDMIEWLYGSGFPKHESCLKPAHEPIMLGRKAGPRSEPLQIDACRVGMADADCHATTRNGDYGKTTPGAVGFTKTSMRSPIEPSGRWPANVVLDPEAAALLDEQTGVLVSGANPTRRGSDKFGRDVYGDFTGQEECVAYRGVDTGGASRFFYCAKAGRDERNAGCESFEAKPLNWSSGDQNPGSFQSDDTDKSARNSHPTVKPIDLMRWLCRLVTPPGGTVLDPFTGSGTTGCAAVLEDFDFIGIEREAEYAAIARARIAHWWKQPVQLGLEAA